MPSFISFRLRHKDLDMSELAAKFGLPIGRIWAHGAQRTTPQGLHLVGNNEGSYCSFKVLSEGGTIASAIDIVGARIKSLDPRDSETLLGSSMSRMIVCTLGSEGEEVPLDSLKLLVKYRIELGFYGV